MREANVPVSPSRKLAFDVLLRVEQGRGFADELLQSLAKPSLKDSDRRLATEIVIGTLRLRGDVDACLEAASGKVCTSLDPEVLTALRIGAYQVRWLAKIPKSAAVNDSVELTKRARKRSAAGFVNAVLRKCEPAPCRPGDSDWSVENPGVRATARQSLPQWLYERWQRNFGESEAAILAWLGIQPPPAALRILGDGSEAERARYELRDAGVRARAGLLTPNSIILEPGQHSSALPLLKEFRAVFQDEASQAVESLLGGAENERVLDLCAAPGLKTSQIANGMQGGLLVACEHSERRLRTMKQLLPRWVRSSAQVCLLRLDAAEDLPFGLRFDRILLDAPCSGTGTIARNPEIKWRLRPEDITGYAAKQRRMLLNALPFLAPGGRLVYSTCSLEPEENEGVVEGVLKSCGGYQLVARSTLVAELPQLASVIGPEGYFRTRPDLHGTDGFFAAVVVRKAQTLLLSG